MSGSMVAPVPLEFAGGLPGSGCGKRGSALGTLESASETSIAAAVNDGLSSCASVVAAMIGHARNETIRKERYFFGSKLFAEDVGSGHKFPHTSDDCQQPIGHLIVGAQRLAAVC